MHNIISDDERELDLECFYDVSLERGCIQRNFTFQDLDVGTREIEDISSHYALRNDPIDYLWTRRGHMM